MSVFILELFGYMALTIDLLLIISIVIGVADLFLMKAGVSVFRREEILTRSA
jgi:ABC-2 type transport system permease protein